ncbi:S41 family peptidase [Euzebyella saccharophila]|uniref:S41 family peptidase n=1 Tax=Euzebyella saccharophila TaxID=679664 RepID=A0ABV8JLI1_9FLAO|nr:S41 family peptidase [Euzebyella saccharophila]
MEEDEKLIRVGKIWGFLKYYHPQVTKGKFNWDEELFSILSQIESISTKDEFSETVSIWINSLGKVKNCKECHSSNPDIHHQNKNINLSWIRDKNTFNQRLIDQLAFIESNRQVGKSHYISQNKAKWAAKNVIPQNEHQHFNLSWKSKNFRLLTLFRLWNMVEYFFPYKYQMDISWDTALMNALPKFKNAATELDFHLAILELVVHLNDSHAGFSTPLIKKFFGTKFIPSKFNWVNKKVIITGHYNDSLSLLNNLKIGDIIVKKDNRDVMEIFRDAQHLIQGSNDNAKFAYAWDKIFNGNTDSTRLEIIRDEKPMTIKVGRYEFKDFNFERPSFEKYKILENNIGYVNLGALEQKDVDEMMVELMNTKGIVFDIRNYPKGTLYAISNYLNPESKPFVLISEPDLKYPGKFKLQKTLNCGGKGKINNYYKGEIIILVNERTISHAEFTAMALQTYNKCTTIGSQTLAADGNVSVIPLPGDLKTRMTGIGIFYPDGTETQRKGVRIDIEVSPTLNGIKNGHDEVLEKALSILQN